MSHRRSHARRALPLALLPLAFAPIATASSQSSATGDSVAIVPAPRVRGVTSGASVGVIDAAEIEASGARTLSELLMARVPGLSVRRRGGLTAEGSAVTARGVVSPLATDIMLVVDGILVDGTQNDAVPGTLATISRLDDLAPSDVQRIEVLRGPAASALYGMGAARGVIVVTTRRGGDGPLSVAATAAAGITQNSASYPANYQLTSGPAGQLCNPRVYYSPAGCTPTTLYSWNPLEQASPFSNGRTTSARAALSGTTLGARTLMAVHSERIGGVTADDWQSRLGVRASVERVLPGRVTVSAQGSYLERDASVGEDNNRLTTGAVLGRALIGRAYDDSLHGYFNSPWTGTTTTQLAEPSTTRTTSALALGWHALPWLDVDAVGGQDRVRQNARRTDTDTQYSEVGYNVSSGRWTSGTLHVGTTAHYGGVANVALTTALSYDDVRRRDTGITGDTIVGTYGTSLSTTTTERRQRTQDATLRQHLGWDDVFDVNLGIRWPVGRGVQAPLGRTASRTADAAFRVPRLRDDIDVRLRAAAGLSQSGTDAWGVRARNGEVEGGVDATFGARARLELTWYRAHARDVVTNDTLVLVPYTIPISGYGYGFGSGPAFPTADVDTHGFEMLASAQLLERADFGWRATVTVTAPRSEVVAKYPLSPPSGSGFDVGSPANSYWNFGYTWADSNGDGFIATSEIHGDNSAYGFAGGFDPTLEVGLRNTLTLPGRISIGALLDYRGGQYRRNETEQLRCVSWSCLGLQDPTLSLADQARWMAIRRSFIWDIEPASFLRLRELTVEWAAPQAVARVVGGERLTIRLVGQNLATWTSYPGIDPEVSSPPWMSMRVPDDRLQWPLPRRMLVELRVGTR